MSALYASGCLTVTLYQPQRAIHRPVVIERAATNFEGLRVLVRCVAHSDYLPVSDASKLCGKLAEDFERQGALAEWVVPYGARFVEPVVFEGAGPDLVVEIESKIDHAYDYPLSSILWCCTYTLIPSVSEHTYSQRVVVIGRDRSVLAEELFRERFVEYNGCGVWTVNRLLDLLVRSKADALSGDAPKEDFTRDFYGQVRQLAFNARIRGEILGLITPASAATVDDDARDANDANDANDLKSPADANEAKPASNSADANPASGATGVRGGGGGSGANDQDDPADADAVGY